MTHPLTSQRKVMDMVLALLMITSFPWIAMGGRNLRTHQVEQNSIDSISKTEGGSFGVLPEWVKISEAPPSSVVVHAGESLDLKCDVLGSPPPNVKWLKDGKVFYPPSQRDTENYEIQGFLEGNDVEELESSNMPGEADVLRHLTGGVVRVSSRLHIPCVSPKHHGVYTCLATLPTSVKDASGMDGQYEKYPQTALASTIVHVQEMRRSKSRFMSCPSSSQGRLRAEGAWIQEWLPVVLQTIGKGVVLTCRAEGNPKPTVSWLDSSGKPVLMEDSGDSRRRVLATGELYIRELTWEDMGGYICVVQNSIGKDSATTFLYPARNDDQS